MYVTEPLPIMVLGQFMLRIKKVLPAAGVHNIIITVSGAGKKPLVYICEAWLYRVAADALTCDEKEALDLANLPPASGNNSGAEMK